MRHTKIILSLPLALAFTLLCACDCRAQSVGKEGNRAVGVVFRDDGTPFAEGEATVAILRREDSTTDRTSGDGVFCVLAPKGVATFQLVYRAAGYWGQITREPIANRTDPIKVKKVLLRKKDSNDLEQLQMIDALVETELDIYRGTSSQALKKEIRDELRKFSESIEIPPRDPVSGITDQERVIGLTRGSGLTRPCLR